VQFMNFATWSTVNNFLFIFRLFYVIYCKYRNIYFIFASL